MLRITLALLSILSSALVVFGCKSPPALPCDGCHCDSSSCSRPQRGLKAFILSGETEATVCTLILAPSVEFEHRPQSQIDKLLQSEILKWFKINLNWWLTSKIDLSMHFLGFLHVENKGLAMTHNQFTINIQIPLKSTEMLSVPFFQWGSKCSNHATYGPLIRAIQLKKIPVCGATSAIEGISRDRVHLVGVLSVCAPNCRAEHLVVHARPLLLVQFQVSLCGLRRREKRRPHSSPLYCLCANFAPHWEFETERGTKEFKATD